MTLVNMNRALFCFWAWHVWEFHLSPPFLVIGFGAFLLVFVSFLFLALLLLDVFGWGGVRLHLRGSLGKGYVLDLISTFDHLIDIHLGPSIGIFSHGTQLGPWMFFICFRSFSNLFQGLDLLLMSFSDLELSPASFDIAIVCISCDILYLAF